MNNALLADIHLNYEELLAEAQQYHYQAQHLDTKLHIVRRGNT